MLWLLLSLLALTHQAAYSIPLDPRSSSSINVQHSGKEYSYTIHENHGGVAIEPLATPHHPAPGGIIKLAPEIHHHREIQEPIVKQKEKEVDEVPPASELRSAQIPSGALAFPLTAIPTYSYLPGYQFGLTYPPYRINYPYNLIRAI